MDNRQIAKSLLNLAKFIVGPPQSVQTPEDEWVTVEEMDGICPSCADKMRAKRISKVRRIAIIAASVEQEILKILDENDKPVPANEIAHRLLKAGKKVSDKTVESALRKLRFGKKVDRVVYANKNCYVLVSSREAAKWETMPKGWTKDSMKKYWDTITGDVKHKVTKCIKRMSDTDITDPGAFCASLADKLDPGWRSRTSAVVDLFDDIKPGDTVTILSPHHTRLKGKATMYNRKIDAWVLNLGGRHGTPGIATRDNVVDVKPSRSRKGSEKVRYDFKNSSDADKFSKVVVKNGFVSQDAITVRPNRITVEIEANKVSFSSLSKLEGLVDKMNGHTATSRKAFFQTEEIEELKNNMQGESPIRRTKIFIDWVEKKKVPFTDFANIVTQLQKSRLAERRTEGHRFSSEVLKHLKSL